MSQYHAWSHDVATEIIGRHKGRKGALLPILHDLQHVFGHVPGKAVPLIANELNLSRAEVYGAITFYHDFRSEPPGKHVLKFCRAEACQASGCDALADYASEKLGVKFGETSRDGQVTLEAVYCLGLCACSPSAMIDGRVVGRLDKAGVDKLIAETRR